MRRCKECGCFLGKIAHVCPVQWLKGRAVNRKKYPKMGHFKKHSIISKIKMSKSHMGNTAHLGKKHTKETKIKISESKKKNPTRYWLGKSRSEETKRKLSEYWMGKLAGDKHPNWQGGKTLEPYGAEFNKKLREIIRKRDGYKCRECNYSQKELGHRLSVHHIDYNKKNNNENNLISLCRSCHMQTNFSRDDWTNYFNKKVGIYD